MFNLCDLVKDESQNIVFKVIDGIEHFVRSLVNKCPIEKGTKIIIPDQTLPFIPRKGQTTMIPSGNYKFTFGWSTTKPNGTLGMIIVEFMFRGLW
jgi:hypothetical protein